MKNNFLANLAANDQSSSRTIIKKKLDADADTLFSSQIAQLSMKMDSLKSSECNTHITSSYGEVWCSRPTLVMIVAIVNLIRIRWSMQMLFSRDLHTTHTLTHTTHVGELIIIFPTRTIMFRILNLHHNLPTNYLIKIHHHNC